MQNCKINIYRKIFLSSIILLLIFSSVNAQTTTCQKANMLIKTAEKYHYAPRALDDNFSELVFNQFIDLLDKEGIFFNIENIKSLEKYKNTIDDDIINSNCNFISEVARIYNQRLNAVDSLIKLFEKQKFDFTKNDSLILKQDNNFVNEKDFSHKWKNIIKYQILSSYLAEYDTLEDVKYPTNEIIGSIKDKVINKEKCRIKSKQNYSAGIEQYIGSIFLKSVAFAFDPHTVYFSPSEENEFSSLLSKESYSYGFDIYRNDLGEIEIYQIVPGSPAWNSNALNEGDVILSVDNSSVEKSFDCLDIEEVIQYLSSTEIDETTFKIRKKNKTVIQIKLKKEKIEVEENIIQSFILEGNKKVGYIYLPSFYTQINEHIYDNSKGCANDIAKEILKLKSDGIEGLIFDLRNNGGGSMIEALQLAGIFVNFGALGIIHTRNEDPTSLKDINRGTIYDDKVVILINSYSASASELFAAAMQDYNRAIIVGAKSFGKSTAQNVLPLDAYKYDNIAEMKDCSDGYLKFTNGKFYRVTGKSHQKEGIIPDIIFPSVYDELNFGEKMYKSALDVSTIDKKTYYYPLPVIPITDLKIKSEERIKNDSSFIYIKKAGKEILKNQKRLSIPLKFEAYKNFQSTFSYYELFDHIQIKNDSLFIVENPSYIRGISSADNSEEEINKYVMDQINRDPFIKEAYNILKDYIDITKY